LISLNVVQTFLEFEGERLWPMKSMNRLAEIDPIHNAFQTDLIEWCHTR